MISFTIMAKKDGNFTHFKISIAFTYLKRMTRIELATPAWEAEVLPLNYIRKTQILLYTKISIFAEFFYFFVIILML